MMPLPKSDALDEKSIVLKVASTRDNIYITGSLYDIEEMANDGEYSNYFMLVIISLFDEDLNEQVAQMRLALYDEDMIAINGEKLITVARDVSPNHAHCFTAFENSLTFYEIDEDMALEKTWVGVLDKLFVPKHHRGKGYGRYLLKNLPAILKFTRNYNLRCISVYQKMQDFTEAEYKRNIHVLKAAGFEYASDDVYIKHFPFTCI